MIAQGQMTLPSFGIIYEFRLINGRASYCDKKVLKMFPSSTNEEQNIKSLVYS